METETNIKEDKVNMNSRVYSKQALKRAVKDIIGTKDYCIKPSKIHFKIVRSFSLGFTIHSPKLNKLSIEIMFACFILHIWSKGQGWFGFSNFYNK